MGKLQISGVKFCAFLQETSLRGEIRSFPFSWGGRGLDSPVSGSVVALKQPLRPRNPASRANNRFVV